MSSKRNAEDERLKAEYIALHGVRRVEAIAPVPLPPAKNPKFVILEEPQKVYRALSDDVGEKPVMLWVSVDDLHVNETYQRSISSRRGQSVIREIVEEFKWSRFQPITITERTDGGYWVIDGQHRMTAARQRGIDTIPSVLLTGLDQSAQARVFAGINGKRVAVNPMTLHYAMVAAGDLEAIRIQSCCDRAGVVITKYPKMAERMHPSECMAVSTLRKTIKKYGEEPVVSVLRSIRAMYPNTPGMLNRDNIEERLLRHASRMNGRSGE